jgi:hypothetical protein
MTRRFEEILDDCIDRMARRRHTVEQCLLIYPEYAVELEPELRAVARALNAYEFTPSTEAKARGRLQLRREMEYLERAKPAGRRLGFSFPALTMGAPAKWAATAAVFMIALGLGSTGVVAASQDDVPGDPLYGVKTTVEEVRLALEFSDKDKAELHLEYAERRTSEISKLLKQGKEVRLANVQLKLEEHLNKAVALTRNVEEKGLVAEIRTMLEEKASKTLADLSVLINSDSENRTAALENLERASMSFGQAIEVIAESAPKTEGSGGAIQIRASEWQAPGLERLTIEIADLEVYRVDGRNKGWALVGPGSQKLDLVKVEGVQTFLGEAQVVAGSYIKLRFRIVGATAIVNGNEIQPRLPSDTVQINRPFSVEEGKTTVLVLEFDPRASMERGDSGRWIFDPKLRVLVDQPSDSSQSREEDDDDSGSRNSISSTSRNSTTVRTTSNQRTEIKVTGRVQTVSNGSLTLRGKSVSITGETRVTGEIREGSIVTVEGVIEGDGVFIAQRIEVTQSTVSTPDGRPNTPDSDLKFSGVVESMVGDMWTVSGLKVQVNQETDIDESPSVGAVVEVEGVRLESGVILAESIEVEEQPRPSISNTSPNTTVSFSGEITSIDGRQWKVGDYNVDVSSNIVMEGTPEVGATAYVLGLTQHDEVVSAQIIKVMEAVRTPSATVEQPGMITPAPTVQGEAQIELKGDIKSMRVGMWLVGDQVVTITGETIIEGLPALGLTVTVVGIKEADGEVKALKVTVEPPLEPSKTPETPQN